MRLSTVFELLLIFLFIAFAASRSVDRHHHHSKHSLTKSRQAPNIKPGSSAPNRYCQCSSLMCNCCRDFSLPVVALKGPGCANVQYLTGDSMRLTMSFGDRILRNITLSGKKPRPVCMGLPGAETKFCGRIYGIQKVGDQFKACLSLELRSLDDIEAALRVSCFKFGPDGVKLEPGRPVPGTDDYDDDDDYGFDDEDDDDDDDFLADDDDEDEENDVDSGDYTGFSALGDEFLDGFFGGSSSSKKKKKTPSTTTVPPVKVTKKPINSAAAPTKTPISVLSSTKAPSSTLESSTPKSINASSSTPAVEGVSSTPSPVVVTSTEFSVKVVQDGNTIEENVNNNVNVEAKPQNATAMAGEEDMTEMTNSTSQPSKSSTGDKKEDEEEDEEEEEEEEEQEDGEEEGEEEEGSSEGSIIESPKEKEPSPQSKDDDENILDGILGSDDDDDDEDEVKDDDDDDDDDDEDEFRQLRSHVPRGPYQPMTLEDQERQFPGLSALIKPPSVPFMSLQEQERRFPGLAALIRPPPAAPQQPEMAFDFPPVRSARTHRRMRLPPV